MLAALPFTMQQLRRWSLRADSYYTHEMQGKRRISKPVQWFKDVLAQLSSRLLECLPIHDAAHGFVAGRSIATHAAVHLHAPDGPRWLIAADLVNWFGSIRARRVASALERVGWTRGDAELVARLCSEGGVLPQGAPTSPVLANFVAGPFDRQLTREAAYFGFVYSRFADDLALSTADPVPWPRVQRLVRALQTTARRANFVVHPRKLQIRRPWQRQVVTGIVVNGGTPRLPREMMRQLRAALHNLGKGAEQPWSAEQIRGAIALVQMVDRERGERMLREFEGANHARAHASPSGEHL